MSNQSTRDQHGRQRFHGAFTGGFSAGYHNTVGSVAGFQPKTFTSTRNSKGETSRFSHRAEDYMDEEDFGEFGIAPKKIRVSSVYSDLQSVRKCSSSPGLEQVYSVNSIGEKILTHSTRPFLLKRNDVDSIVEVLNQYLRSDNSNFYCLGYRPLRPQSCSSTILFKDARFSNPVTATLKDGQKLKITGEAFGAGVLDDDDEHLDYFDTFGYHNKDRIRDTMKHSASAELAHPSDYQRPSTIHEDDALPGFTSAKRNNVIEICDKLSLDYKPPEIPDFWKPPIRKSELRQIKRDAVAESNLKNFKLTKFEGKFTSSSSSILRDTECKAGLISYSEFKAHSVNKQEEIETTSFEKPEGAFMKRQEFDWFPCSLLCKHFNIPNPHPLGAAPTTTHLLKDNLEDGTPEITSDNTKNFGPVPLEFRKLVFNITFTKQEDLVELESSSDYDDAPQVETESFPSDEKAPTVTSRKGDNDSSLLQQLDSSESGSEVVIVEPVCREPEVILISSSSSRSSIQPSENEADTCERELYGPPIPPTMKASQNYHQKRRRKKRKKDKRRSR